MLLLAAIGAVNHHALRVAKRQQEAARIEGERLQTIEAQR